MKYYLTTPCGLSLEITKEQADKAINFGKELYHVDITKRDTPFIKYTSYLVIDGDMWVYEIKALD